MMNIFWFCLKVIIIFFYHSRFPFSAKENPSLFIIQTGLLQHFNFIGRAGERRELEREGSWREKGAGERRELEREGSWREKGAAERRELQREGSCSTY